jgi:TetR/AcrR family transcriptional regulator, transcriptional repressor for nem operon
LTKGERTRQLIVERAAPVFNTRGYFGASLQDLIRETGLEKGGIYNHFDSKEAIALAAFDHAVGLIEARFRDALAGREGARDRLRAIVEVFREVSSGEPLPGGCPVLNTAIEADDAQPALRDRARGAMTSWLKLIGGTVKRGIERGELRPEVDPRAVATIVAATLEGAVMLTRLYDDPAYIGRAIDHLSGYFDGLANPGQNEGERA